MEAKARPITTRRSFSNVVRAVKISGHLVCQDAKRSADETCEHIKIRNIIVSARLGKLRIAPLFYNSQGDADAMIDALAT